MRFEPKSEEELRATVLEPGVYDGEILKAVEKTSKKGNPMIELTMKFYGAGDDSSIVMDYLLESMPKKLRHFAEAAGILDLYDSGEFSADDCQGLSIKAKLKIDRDPNGQYDDKNAVADYVVDKVPGKIEKYPINRKAPMADPNARLQEAANIDEPF
jgi:hypothetical protein